MGEYNARLQRALLRDRHDNCVKPRSIYDKIEEAACWIFLAGWAFAIIAEVMR